jgi:hypothetical protein
MSEAEADVATTDPTAVRKRAGAQSALDEATEDCSAFAKLSVRLERVRVAFEGRASTPSAPGETTAKSGTRPTSHLEGLAFIHTCNTEVLRRMELVVGRFEDLLDCRAP